VLCGMVTKLPKRKLSRLPLPTLNPFVKILITSDVNFLDIS
jgi:hypothetical protein